MADTPAIPGQTAGLIPNLLDRADTPVEAGVAVPPVTHDAAMMRTFLTALWDGTEALPVQLQITVLPARGGGARTAEVVPGEGPEGASGGSTSPAPAWVSNIMRAAVMASTTCNVYVDHAPRRKGSTARGAEGDCAALCALVVDLDVKSAHHADATFLTKADAVSFLDHHPDKPHLIVDSGGGIQAWWLLAEPVTERVIFDDLLALWGNFWLATGERNNEKVDYVFDVTRMMRLPGTWNHSARQLAVIHTNNLTLPRYNVSDLQDHTPRITTTKVRGKISEAVRSLRSGGASTPPDLTAGVIGWFNSRTDLILNMLVDTGWKIERTQPVTYIDDEGGAEHTWSVVFLLRPGKESGTHSAVWNHQGLGRLKVFSSNAVVKGRNGDVALPAESWLTGFEYARIVLFDGQYDKAVALVAKLSDLYATVEERVNRHDAAVEAATALAQASGDGRRIVVYNPGHEGVVVSDMASALLSVQEELGLYADIDGRIIDEQGERINKDRMRPIAANHINFMRGDKATAIPQDLLGSLVEHRFNGLRRLNGIVNVPILHRDLTIRTEEGYDEETGLLLRDSVPVEIIEDPVAANAVLDDLLTDFPFADESDRTHVKIAILTAVARSAIDGQIPLVLVDASSPGSGKGLIADVIKTIAIGHGGIDMATPPRDDELEKRLVGVLRTRPRVVLMDETLNVHHRSLASYVTSWPTWSGRLLGKSEVVKFPANAMMVLMGNNIETGGDMARRCLMIRLDNPARDRQFRHPHLIRHIQSQRGRILGAVLGLVQAWSKAGCPDVEGEHLPSFEIWHALVGGVANIAGWADFDPFRVENEATENDTGLRGLNELFGYIYEWKKRWTMNELHEQVGRVTDLGRALESAVEGTTRPTIRELGRTMRTFKGRAATGMKFMLHYAPDDKRSLGVKMSQDGGRYWYVKPTHGLELIEGDGALEQKTDQKQAVFDLFSSDSGTGLV